MRQTPLSQLLAVRLGADLREHVVGQRATGADWRTIATELTATTGVDVSHETLRSWFADELGTAVGAA